MTTMRAAALLAALSAAVTATAARPARAQVAATALIPPPYAEYRADAIVGRGTTVQAGGGVTVPMGMYVRLAVIGAAGTTTRDRSTAFSGRTDAIARFLFDPLRETPAALSLGGGVSVPYERGTRVRPYLTAVIDVEGRRRGPVTPALQVGLGGGARIGVALRASPRNRR